MSKMSVIELSRLGQDLFDFSDLGGCVGGSVGQWLGSGQMNNN